MDTLPFQNEIAARMLVNTEGETIHPDARFFQTANGYWAAWYEGVAAVLPPDAAPGNWQPCWKTANSTIWKPSTAKRKNGMRQGIPAVAAARTGMKPIEWAGRPFSDGLQAGTARLP